MVFVEKPLFLHVGRGSNARNFHRCAEHGVAHLAGHHIDLVAGGDGDQHFRIVRSRPPQDVWVRCRALDGLNIKAHAKFLQTRSVDIDQGDVEGFLGETFGEGATDLPCPQDQYFHDDVTVDVALASAQ